MPDTIIKTLKKPWKIGGQTATEIEVRPSTIGDVCDAEKEVSSFQVNAFTVEMACRQIVRAGQFTGPFVKSHFTGMRSTQLAEIKAALQEADALGEE